MMFADDVMLFDNKSLWRSPRPCCDLFIYFKWLTSFPSPDNVNDREQKTEEVPEDDTEIHKWATPVHNVSQHHRWYDSVSKTVNTQFSRITVHVGNKTATKFIVLYLCYKMILKFVCFC